MKAWVKIALSILLLAMGTVAFGLSAAYWYFCSGRGDAHWSSESPAVRAELDAGFLDLTRGYVPDAAIHFERALELDPKNAPAMAFLSSVYHMFDGERQRYLDSLAKVDKDGLTPFEQFLVALAPLNKPAETSELVNQFLAEYPDEPFARNIRCDLLWEKQQWDDSESCYRDLIASHPEWVAAQQRLGDLAMARGRFREAEDHYLTFRFVAPDQAGPWYSLGQLYLLLGRFEESEQAQGKALELKPDFCMAYTGLVHLYLYWNRLDDAQSTLDRIDQQPTCAFNKSTGVSCVRRAYLSFLRDDLQGGYAQFSACQRTNKWSLIGHHMAAATGDLEFALRMEGELARELAVNSENNFLSAYLHHNRGVRLLAQREFPKACEELAQADQELGFWAGEVAFVVLMNKLYHIACLEQSGQTAEAEKARAAFVAFNPRLLQTFSLPEYRSSRP